VPGSWRCLHCLLKIGGNPDRPALSARGAGFRTKEEEMPETPATTYVVRVFEKPHWRTVLTTNDKTKALALAKEIGDKVRVDTITPKPEER
jgi:hypothetical protein